MDPIKTGALIRTLRQQQHLTQLALAQKLHVSDKTVSKWERGCGAPDVSLLPLLAGALDVNLETLLKGELEENDRSNGNMKKLKFYCCPTCGNVMFAANPAEISCCGKKLEPLTPQKADPDHELQVERSDGEWYVTADHEMRREHYISYVALLTGDTVLLRKRYPEWNLDVRMPLFAHGRLFWFCTRHGLFYRDI